MGPVKNNTDPIAKQHSATPAQRDRFLVALDSGDAPALSALSDYLRECNNILPTDTCEQLGLDKGSTYGQAVCALEQRARERLA